MPPTNGTIPSVLDETVNIDGQQVRLGDFFSDEKSAGDFKLKLGLLKQPGVPVQSGAPGGGEPDGLDPIMKQMFGGM